MLTDSQKKYLASQDNQDTVGVGEEQVPTPDPHEDLVGKCLDYLGRYKPDMDYLQTLREKLHRAYNQEPYGNEMEGRSKVVMSDVADTIEWIMPSLMRIFYGGTDVVKISGQGPEDEQGAKLLNEKVNHDFTRGFNGYLLLYDWFKDALLDKMGVVKYWWEEAEQLTPREYTGLNDMELQSLLATRFKLGDHQTEQTPLGPQHAVAGHEVKHISHPMAEVLPPEEFIWDLKARHIKESEFAAHRKRVHKTELMRKYDLKEEDLDFSGKETLTTDWGEPPSIKTMSILTGK
jgi:hypothetical protein